MRDKDEQSNELDRTRQVVRQLEELQERFAKLGDGERETNAFWGWAKCLDELSFWAREPDPTTTMRDGWREAFRNDIRDKGDLARDAAPDDVTHDQVIRSRTLALKLVRLLNESPTVTATEASKPSPDGKPKKPTINARMIDTLGKRPEAKDWSVTQWQEHLGGKTGRATIHGTNTWKELEKMRTAAKATRLDRDSFRDDHGRRKAKLR